MLHSIMTIAKFHREVDQTQSLCSHSKVKFGATPGFLCSLGVFLYRVGRDNLYNLAKIIIEDCKSFPSV